MPRYDYSRVPAELCERLGRATLRPNSADYIAAYYAAEAAARVPERTRAELAEALLVQMEASLLPDCHGEFSYTGSAADGIRALVNEARMAPSAPPNETKASVARDLAEYCERAAKNPYADTPFDSAVLYAFAGRYRRAT